MTGARVVVTGAASGIGVAIAERFVAAGARVHICDIAGDQLQATLAKHPELHGTLADVGEPADVQRLFAEAFDRMGGVDVLVNNCGIAGPRAAIDEVSIEDWDRTIRVNLSGMFYCIRCAVPEMKRQRQGVILNISTTSARTGAVNRVPYVAAKVGVLGLTLNAARELGPWNIRCNAILPGVVDNERGRRVVGRIADERGVPTEQVWDEFLQFVSMRSAIQPSEVADLAVFLASDAASHISGQTIGVCGNVEWEA
jgi:NAD(P)-dependent dehydrogenase (short-subunit alcohol dehydrogenase family)